MTTDPIRAALARLKALADDERRYVSSSGHLDHVGWCKEIVTETRAIIAALEETESLTGRLAEAERKLQEAEERLAGTGWLP